MPSMFEVDHIGEGRITLHVITVKKDGTWEPEWEPLRQAAESDPETWEPIIDMLPEVPSDVYMELRHNYSKPFFDLGVLSPKYCLIRLPERYKPCLHLETCPSYNAGRCHLDRVNLPMCFDLTLQTNQLALSAVNRLVDLWRADSYVILHLSHTES